VQAHGLFVTDLVLWQTSTAPAQHSILSVSADRTCVRTRVEPRSPPMLLLLSVLLLILIVAAAIYLAIGRVGADPIIDAHDFREL